MIAIQQSERNGKVVAATLVHADDDGVDHRQGQCWCAPALPKFVSSVAPAQGVTLIGLDEGSKLSGLQRIVENDANTVEGDAGESAEGAADPGEATE